MADSIAPGIFRSSGKHFCVSPIFRCVGYSTTQTEALDLCEMELKVIETKYMCKRSENRISDDAVPDNAETNRNKSTEAG